MVAPPQSNMVSVGAPKAHEAVTLAPLCPLKTWPSTCVVMGFFDLFCASSVSVSEFQFWLGVCAGEVKFYGVSYSCGSRLALARTSPLPVRWPGVLN